MRGKGGRWGPGALAAILTAAGLALVVLGLRGPAGPPSPPAWAATTRAVDGHGPVLDRSPPVRVSIPSIGVRAPLARLGLVAGGEVQVPRPIGRGRPAGTRAGRPPASAARRSSWVMSTPRRAPRSSTTWAG